MKPRGSDLATALGQRFRIGLTGTDLASGGSFAATIRADDLPAPHGFAVRISSNWRSVEAEFVPDNFAGALVRALGDALHHSRQIFEELVSRFTGQGYKIAVRVNDSAIPAGAALPPPIWTAFALSIRQLSDLSGDSDARLREEFERIATVCFAMLLSLLPLEDDPGETVAMFETGLPEGARTLATVNRYERSPANRAACLAIHGTACHACKFDFGDEYGEFARGYIEVHHRIPVSRMGEGYVVDPAADLIPLCANCHAAVHRVDPPMSVEDLKMRIRARDTADDR